MNKIIKVKRVVGITLTIASLIVTALTPKTIHGQPGANSNWSFTGNLNSARYGHSATLLPDGRVLVAGGWGFGQFGVQSGAEIYDPASGTWAMTNHLSAPRFGHTAILLPNGRVLVIGGLTVGRNNAGFSTLAPSKSVEVFDPATGGWRASAIHSGPKIGEAILLSNGRVLVIDTADRSADVLGAELYDPDTETWSSTNAPSAFGSLTRLGDGTILLVGACGLTCNNAAEVYDPTTQTWRSIPSPQTGGLSTLLPNGKVLIVGSGLAQLYDPLTETWTTTSPPKFDLQSATLLRNGRVLGIGGFETTGFESANPNAAEVYDPVTETWNAIANLNAPRLESTVTPLRSGQVLVAGGMFGDGETFSVTQNSAELGDLASSRSNLIDDAEFFVHQHYRDFLLREPDSVGLRFWLNDMVSCQPEPQCVEVQRINDSAAFFLSIEFQQTGYEVYRIYKASYGNLPDAPVPIKLTEFIADQRLIGRDVVVNRSGWEEMLERNQQAFAAEFVHRAHFISAYPASMPPDAFIDQLFANAGVTPSAQERTEAIEPFGFAGDTGDTLARARALRQIAQNPRMIQQEFNHAFVLMQYFGYLRRDPNSGPDADFAGYNFWLNKLDAFNGNFIEAEMVKAFINSTEYRQRFGE